MRLCVCVLAGFSALLWALVEQQAEVYRFYRRLGLEDAV